jgi:hypothetical protein
MEVSVATIVATMERKVSPPKGLNFLLLATMYSNSQADLIKMVNWSLAAHPPFLLSASLVLRRQAPGRVRKELDLAAKFLSGWEVG